MTDPHDDQPELDQPDGDLPEGGLADGDLPGGGLADDAAGRPPGVTATGAGSLASIWARGAARAIDLFLVMATWSLVLNWTGVIEVVDDEVEISNQLTAVLVLLGVWALYEVAGTLAGGRMVGKLVLGLRVRSAATDAPPSFVNALVRWAVPAVAVLLPIGGLQLLVLIVVYLTAMTDARRQGIHDRVARTLVVRAR